MARRPRRRPRDRCCGRCRTSSSKSLRQTLRGIDRALGYFGNEPYVLFAYEDRAGEVMWKDGQSCGISHGAWDVLGRARRATRADARRDAGE